MNEKEIDRFQEIAGGGKKKLTAEIKRLEEIKPLELNREEYAECKLTEVKIPVFDEEKAYSEFIKEKAELRKKSEPFLVDFGGELNTPVVKTRLKEFYYRKETEEDKKDFGRVLRGDGEWEKIILPKYEGPAGRWNAFYRATIDIGEKKSDKRYMIDFEAVDYIAEVYLNGRLITRHEGFFAPFKADLTENISSGENTLLVVVKNDITTSGVSVNGAMHYGNKIYAATHLGYDEPYSGWHHCPPGAGIFGTLDLCVTDSERITDVFVRPDIDSGKITVNATITDYTFDAKIVTVKYKVEGRNFRSKVYYAEEVSKKMTNGCNYFRKEINLGEFRLWTTDKPYLYNATVTVISDEGKILDEVRTHFGMRKFTMDENSTPKGAFYLNNERIILRGTNEMGHLPRAVMEDDDNRLIDDILTAKVAHLNFYRMTQRPVFNKIYDYFDMLGMLCQSDFPLFSYINYTAVGEGLKQVDEMERLTRNHPSVIVETFCNETLDRTAWGAEQYRPSRYELENFFNAGREVIRISNPDRVIKYNEGDYAPLAETYGISDFHCYTFWYVSHGMPSGRLNKGYLPPVRKEWYTGCGEYGVDGLDRLDLMRKYCPKEWLPESDEEPWSPKPIAKEQCFVLHGDFFPEQENAREWIKRSREWQREAIKEYVHILRRRTDMIESTAVHLLIDAWPCGWTKTLVDVDRIPKPAYYAFKEANILTRVSLRRDKYTVYAGDEITTEIYALNDTANEKTIKITASVYYGEKLRRSYYKESVANACIQSYTGKIRVRVPEEYIGEITVAAKSDCNGETTYDCVKYTVKKPMIKSRITPEIRGERVRDIIKVCGGEKTDKVIICDNDYFTANQKSIEERVKRGAKAVIFTNKSLNVIGDDVIFPVHTLAEEVRANNFVARNEKSKYTEEFGAEEFKNFYNAEKDYQDLTAWFKFEWRGAEEILYTFEDCNDPKYALRKKHKLIAAEKKYGEGSVILSTLSALSGCVGFNPVLDKFIINLIEK